MSGTIDVGTMLVGYKADITGLMDGMNQAKTSMSSADSVAQSSSTAISSAFLEAGSSVTQFAERTVSGVDVAKANLTLLEAKVTDAREKLQTLQNSANAGEAVSGIGEAEAKLTLLEAKAQGARESLQTLQQEEASAGESAIAMADDEEVASSAVQKMGNSASTAGEHVGGGGGFLGGIKSAIGGIGSFVMNAGMTIFSLQQIGQMAVGAATSLLGPATSAETMRSAFTTLLGSTKAATDEMERLDAFASKTPFTTLDIDKAASELIAFKTNASDVVPELTAIGDELGSVGRGTAANMDSIVNIFGKIRTEGKLTIGTMSELSINGIDAWSALERSTGKTQEQLKNMISAGLIPADQAIRLLTSGIEANPLYSGGMARQSATMTGLISTLKSNWDQLLASFGDPILKGLEPIINNLGAAIAAPAFKEFAGKIGQGIVDAFGAIGKAGTQVSDIFHSMDFSGLILAWTDLKESVRTLAGQLDIFVSKIIPVKSNLEPLGQIIQSLASGGVRILTDAIWEAYKAISGFGMAIDGGKGPLMALAPPIKNIADLLGGELKKELDFVGESAKQFGQWFMTSVVPALAQAEPGFEALTKGLLDLYPVTIQIHSSIFDLVEHAIKLIAPPLGVLIPQLITFGGELSKLVGGALTYMAPALKDAVKALGDFGSEIMDRVAPIVNNWISDMSAKIKIFADWWNTNWPLISGVLKGVWDGIVGIIKMDWALFSGIIKVGLDLFSGNWGKAWEDVKTTLKGIWDGMITLLKGVWEIIKAIFAPVVKYYSDQWQQVQKNTKDAWDGMSRNITETWTSVSNWLSDAWKNLLKFTTDLWHQISKNAQDGFSDVVRWVRDGWSNVSTIFSNAWSTYIAKPLSSLWQSFSSSVSNAWSTLSGGFASLWNSISGWVGNQASKATQWGKDIIANIAGGINSGISNVSKTISNLGGQAMAAIGGGHAAGGHNLPAGWSVIGEEGPELQYTPQGASILPNDVFQSMMRGPKMDQSMPPGGGGQRAAMIASGNQGAPAVHVHVQNNQPDIYLDGQMITSLLGPHIANAIRLSGGVRVR